MNSLFKPLIDMAIYIRMFQHYLGIRMYVIFIFSTVASILEGFGILMILPLLESIGGVEGAVQEGNGLSLFIYQMINFLGLSSSTVSILLIIVIVFILKGITTMLTLTINSYLIGELLKNIKVNLFELYTNMSFSYYCSSRLYMSCSYYSQVRFWSFGENLNPNLLYFQIFHVYHHQRSPRFP